MLGALLVLLYINDIGNCSDKLKFCLFADDTSLLYANRDLKSLEKTVNAELQKLCEWLTANRLTLNIKKSNWPYFVPIKGYFPINLKFGYLTLTSNHRFF